MPRLDDDDASADRVAIVVGGSRGLGREVILELAGRGFAVAVGYAHDQGAADGLVDAILGAGCTAMAIRGDVVDELDVERLFTETAEAFGGVDVVVDAVLRAASRGTFVVEHQAAGGVRAGGAMVTLACGADPAGVAAVAAVTRAVADDLRPRDITVNAVVVQSAAAATVTEVAGLVTFLVGGGGRSVTGQVLSSGDQASTRAGPGRDGPAGTRP